jgi:uncharacterized membrane protein
MTGSGIPPSPAIEPEESAYSRDRIITLSDGVFAIAITLLVLEIVPHIADTVTGRRLVRALLDMAPALAAYFLSFLVIGRFWDTHRTFFRYIHLADWRVTWANLLALLWITLIPATAALLGSHVREPAALTLYAVNLLLATASLWALWRCASSAGYVRQEGLHARVGQYLDRYAAASAVGYALAIPAAFLSPLAALALVFLTTTLARTTARRVLTPGATPGREAASDRHRPDAARLDEINEGDVGART